MAYDGTPFGYRPAFPGNVRDKAYPEEIARQRPALATRIHCHEHYEDVDPGLSVRGQREPGGESPSERFHQQLRGGHSQRERD